MARHGAGRGLRRRWHTLVVISVGVDVPGAASGGPAARDLVATPAMPLPAAQTARVNDRGDHQDQQVDSRNRLVIIHHPCVDEGGEGQEDEAEQRNQQAVIGTLQIRWRRRTSAPEPGGGTQDEQEQEARHLASIVAELRELAPCGFAPVESNLRMSSTPRIVLIVDDDRQILGLVEKMLRPQGVTVLSANRPSEALRICEEQAVDVLISDVMMPEMDGGKLAERFLKLRPEACVLLISGQAKAAGHVEAAQCATSCGSPSSPRCWCRNCGSAGGRGSGDGGN